MWHFLITLTTVSWYKPLQAIRPRSPFENILALILAIQGVLAAIQVLTLPNYPREYDTYGYHWAIPQQFLLHHAVYSLPGSANFDFPINAEMLYVITLALNSPIATLMIQMVFGILAVLLISGFLYRHYGSFAAWLGVLTCVTSALFMGYLSSGYIEPATTFYGAATVVVIFQWFHLQKHKETVPDPRLPLLAGIFAGLGVGVKYQTGTVVVGVVLLLAAAAVFHLLAAWPRPGEILARFGFAMALYVGGIVVMLLPWWLKDWVSLGNPIYPFVGGGPGWTAIRAQVAAEIITHFGPEGSLAERLVAAFFQLFVNNGRADDSPFLPLNGLLLLAPLLVPVELIRLWKGRQSAVAGERQKIVQELALCLMIAGSYGAWVIAHVTEDRYSMSWSLLLVVPAVFSSCASSTP